MPPSHGRRELQTESKPTTAPFRFADDRPIHRRSEDRLGRAGFADAIAKAIRGWRGRESLVIALYGQWGSGKSSVKNMVRETLKESSPKPVRVVEFNPWQFANREQLTQAFFDQIGIGLGRGPLSTFRGRARLAGRWRRYAAYLRSSKDLVAVAELPFTILIIAFAVVLGSSTFVANSITLAVAGALVIIAVLLGWSSRFANAIQGILAVGGDVAQKSLEEVREELAQALDSLSVPLLVMIDDIDRLAPAETAEMLQLIKANADFPNLVYVVFFDRETVEKNIMQALQTPGRKYLEKVVQTPFDIPTVEPIKLRRFLVSGLDELLADAEVARRFDQTRWGNLFLGGLAPYFQTLRAVKRFLSTLSFHVEVFRSQQAFEVNPIDLIALETLRMFEPAVHHLIRENKAALTERHERHLTDQARDVVLAIVGAASQGRDEQVREIVKQLFPTTDWALGGSEYSHDFDENWERDLRVCSDDIFERYFVLTTPEGQLSETALVNLLAATHDRTTFRTTLQRLAADGLMKAALERLEAYKQRIDAQHAQAFVTALFDVSEDIPDDRGMFEMSAQVHARRIVYWYLKQDVFTEAERAAVIVAAVRETEGLALPVHVVSLELQRQAEQPAERFLDPAAMGALKELCVEKIRQAAADGTLIRSHDFMSLLYRWYEWTGNSDEPKRFCEERTNTPEGVAELLEQFLQQSRSHGMDDYVSRTHWHIRLSTIEPFVSIETLQEAVASIDRRVLSVEQSRGVKAFEKAVRRRAEGKPEDDPFQIDDE